jgi:hypothetical protein
MQDWSYANCKRSSTSDAISRQTLTVRTLEQAQSALQKATSRAADADERSQPECEHETKLAEVRAELEGKKSKLEAVRLRLADAENCCTKSKPDADTLHTWTAAGLVNTDVDQVMHT